MKIARLVVIALLLCVVAGAQTNSYTVTPIVNNTQDPYLINPWGLSRPVSASVGENEWWAADNGTGYSTLYYADKSGITGLVGVRVDQCCCNAAVLDTREPLAGAPTR